MESNHPSGGLLRPAGFEDRMCEGLALLESMRLEWLGCRKLPSTAPPERHLSRLKQLSHPLTRATEPAPNVVERRPGAVEAANLIEPPLVLDPPPARATLREDDSFKPEWADEFLPRAASSTAVPSRSRGSSRR